MFDAIGLPLRQQAFEKPLPPCRIIALAKPARSRPIKHKLDPVAHPACRFRNYCPDWLKDAQHARQINIGDRQIADFRIGIIFKALLPLLARTAALPTALMRRNVCGAAFFEGLGVCGRKQPFAFGSALLRHWVAAGCEHAPIFNCLIARLGQGYVFAAT